MNLHRECSHCGQFREMSKGGNYIRNVCKPCWNIQQKAWRSKNKQQWSDLQKRYRENNKKKPEWVASERKRGRDYWRSLRSEALDVYGRSCACCGEQTDAFLTIDHINNDGAAHRKQMKTKGSAIWKWIRDNRYPKTMQTLCMNCNFGKHINKGICPHKDQTIALMKAV